MTTSGAQIFTDPNAIQAYLPKYQRAAIDAVIANRDDYQLLHAKHAALQAAAYVHANYTGDTRVNLIGSIIADLDRDHTVFTVSWFSPERYCHDRTQTTTATRTQLAPGACRKCDGTGFIPQLAYSHGGVCYACNGTGKAKRTPTAPR